MNCIHPSWKSLFDEFDIKLEELYSTNEKIYPLKDNILRVFEMNINDINIVLLGQDPYHSIGQANGLSFSVPSGHPIPASLRNIYKELKRTFPDRNYELG